MNAAPAARQASSQSEWFRRWFDSPHYHRLYAHRDDDEAARLVDHLIERRHLTIGATVLDLGCGTGRHSRYLASRGFYVTGLDLSAESLRQARLREGGNLRFIRQDMRLPFRSCPFDHVLNLFTSFGYFEDPADHMSVVHNIAGSLKPHGTLVLDYLNPGYVDAHLRAQEVVEAGGAVYRLQRWSDACHIFKRIVIDEGRGEAPLEYVERVARFTAEDFRFMFELCDLAIEEIYGDYSMAPFDAQTSRRLILVARKGRGGSGRPSSSRQILTDTTDGLGCHAKVRREHGLRNAQRD